VRVPYESYRSPDKNPVCDAECRDEGMLARLQQTIDAHPTGDIVIVLHQMGNHGPAYSKRYPKAFERFTPVCRNSDLSQCSQAEIVNAYDNAILYTDYFLSRAIGILKHNNAKFETALLYVSDHGESLGEHGVYLHGLPRAIAPEAQTHVPVILWLGENYEQIDHAALARKRDTPYTHDLLFHTLLGFLEVQTDGYRAELDLLTGVRTYD
jgi:lipid A ethanolaminephosphotransferase